MGEANVPAQQRPQERSGGTDSDPAVPFPEGGQAPGEAGGGVEPRVAEAEAEAQALMARLGAQFGDLDLSTLGIGTGGECETGGERDTGSPSSSKKAGSEEEGGQAPGESGGVEPRGAGVAAAEAEAQALMARLGAQFGDLDLSTLGIGTGGETGSPSSSKEAGSEESSLWDPTPEELAEWQASQFARGDEQKRQQKEDQQKQLQLQPRNGSVRERRRRLRALGEGAPATPTELLAGQGSVFFAPPSGSGGVLEELAGLAPGDAAGDPTPRGGDPEVLGRAPWKRLYASYEQGLGFPNLWHALRGYDGPTLLVLRPVLPAQGSPGTRPPPAATTDAIGFYTTAPWEEGQEYFGGEIGGDADRAFLFSVRGGGGGSGAPEPACRRVRFFPARPTEGSGKDSGSGGRYMYCFPSTGPGRARAKNSCPTAFVHGIGVGGRPSRPRFHLTETLEGCRCLAYDPDRSTLDGDLFAHCGGDENDSNAFAEALYYFDVAEMEAWGVGGEEWIGHALSEREASRKRRIQRYQTVDKRMVWDGGAFAPHDPLPR
ncbi:unnamed protein product [Pseudo-nitzschia multistriata]|uniref:TLDc domain-containing protein n=1 Tax=Pseudo-nitzschia multistriata TaxID=183589 RepID=A0A448YW46_9STRA|nr:unnamed protein product [Pseudo-nitzschia multistriata]